MINQKIEYIKNLAKKAKISLPDDYFDNFNENVADDDKSDLNRLIVFLEDYFNFFEKCQQEAFEKIYRKKKATENKLDFYYKRNNALRRKEVRAQMRKNALRFKEKGYTMQEIANALNITENQAQVLIYN